MIRWFLNLFREKLPPPAEGCVVRVRKYYALHWTKVHGVNT